MTGTCVGCGAADVEVNEEGKCATCSAGMEAAPAEAAPEAPAEAPAEGGDMGGGEAGGEETPAM